MQSNPPVKVLVVSIALATVSALSYSYVHAAAQAGSAAPAAKAAALDPEALKALDRMGAYLRGLKSFQLTSDTSRDEVLGDGQRIAFGGRIELLVQRPNRLRAEVTSDKQQRFYFYNGESFTLFARRLNYYTTVAAPPTLAALADTLADKYDLELPLTDLFYWGERNTSSAITRATDVGPSQIEGTTCEHYAFRQEGVDWQIWIQQGEFPLPRKLVITTTTDDARPQFSSVMTWNLAPSFNEGAFTFVAPKDARKIAFAQVDDSGGK